MNNMPGYGDEITWGPCNNHPLDPRTQDYNYTEEQEMYEELGPLDARYLEELRQRGFAVVVFAPAELADTDPSLVEDLMVERGWAVIEQETA